MVKYKFYLLKKKSCEVYGIKNSLEPSTDDCASIGQSRENPIQIRSVILSDDNDKVKIVFKKCIHILKYRIVYKLSYQANEQFSVRLYYQVTWPGPNSSPA